MNLHFLPYSRLQEPDIIDPKLARISGAAGWRITFSKSRFVLAGMESCLLLVPRIGAQQIIS